MKINHALIMAAGRGMRMRPLTKKIPKAMAKLNGISLISYNLKKISDKIKYTHITVGYKNSLLAVNTSLKIFALKDTLSILLDCDVVTGSVTRLVLIAA